MKGSSADGRREPLARLTTEGLGQSLKAHLTGVAERAGRFAGAWGNGDWGALAGLWHDLGKYSAAFQNYIRGANGIDAHIETAPKRVDHSTAGALHARDRMGLRGRVLSYAIAGHHAGLANWADEDVRPTPLSRRLAEDRKPLLREALEGSRYGAPDTALLNHPLPTSRPPEGCDPAFWIRMLFSALVDADVLDAETFSDPGRADGRRTFPDISALLPVFDRHVDNLVAKAIPSPVNDLRREVLDACRRAAADPPGLFSLTVPTGGGKTLSSLAFALRHACRHGLRRIIYVIPYTSIVEQTADVFRGALADLGDVIVEHHSSVDADRETPASRLAMENWDAPLIVTTNVQFFESLFAARTSRCRKLHNIARSVVILDEAHLLPPDFLTPILFAIEQLIRFYGASIVLSTATPPALDPRPADGFGGLSGRREIVPDPDRLRRRLVRVRLRMPADLSRPVSWEELAGDLRRRKQVLCIVDRKRDCRDLHALLENDAFHLSALMCPEHRSTVLREIRRRLEDSRPARVISTQLVEAGVDIDFPVVYRAFAGLPSIAQAAGRCNREGRLPEPGEVIVFVPPSDPPPGILGLGRSIARAILEASGDDDPLSLANFNRFFRDLYWLRGRCLDKHDLLSVHLKPDRELRFNFATAASLFRLIDGDERSLVVPYGAADEIVAEIEREGPNRDRQRRLQRFSVSIPAARHARLVSAGAVRELENAPGLFVLVREDLYHPETGLIDEPDRPAPPEDLIA